MTDALEIRRRPTRQQLRILGVRVGILLLGLAALVPGVLALLTQPLSSDQTLQACFLVAAGGFATGVGALGSARVWRIGTRMVVLRLDEQGVHLCGGAIERPRWSSAVWEDIEAVEVRAVNLEAPAWRTTGEPMSALRFVPRSDDLVRTDPPTAFTHIKASSLGLTPAAAALTMLQGPTSEFRIPLILDWVREHRPAMRIDDLRTPDRAP